MMPSSLSMPRFRHGVLLLCLSAAVLALIQSASVSAVGRRIGTQQRHPSLATQYGSLPLIFEPNQGQMDESVAFLARTHGAASLSVMKQARE